MMTAGRGDERGCFECDCDCECECEYGAGSAGKEWIDAICKKGTVLQGKLQSYEATSASIGTIPSRPCEERRGYYLTLPYLALQQY